MAGQYALGKFSASLVIREMKIAAIMRYTTYQFEWLKVKRRPIKMWLMRQSLGLSRTLEEHGEWYNHFREQFGDDLSAKH